MYNRLDNKMRQCSGVRYSGHEQNMAASTEQYLSYVGQHDDLCIQVLRLFLPLSTSQTWYASTRLGVELQWNESTI